MRLQVNFLLPLMLGWQFFLHQICESANTTRAHPVLDSGQLIFNWTKTCVFFLTVTVSASAKHRRRTAEDFSCRLGFSVNWVSEQKRKHLNYYPAHICWGRLSRGLFDIHRHANMCMPECKLSHPIVQSSLHTAYAWIICSCSLRYAAQTRL